ncbi:GDYXXLXY domain-containing protein [Marinimicrobium agarilyticum]|uniref:GDYXXLXY domain-containing protein n=1 Tax=Marinimicrobium agarilyticum TaxID=306546 RepID=UPI0004102414|nr:GDYXXLXY domain-containing protein [Marinimicrobium agarilyticum]
MHKGIALITGLVILGLVNWSIVEKEQHLKHGEVIFLELAPVDPRSLMQGDYMALRFEVGNRVREALSSRDQEDSNATQGYAIVRLDEQKVAHFVRLGEKDETLAPNERRLYFRQRDGRVQFATNAYFFEEGQAERYEPARYGRFRVNEQGEPLLVGMHDAELERLDPALPPVF